MLKNKREYKPFGVGLILLLFLVSCSVPGNSTPAPAANTPVSASPTATTVQVVPTATSLATPAPTDTSIPPTATQAETTTPLPTAVSTAQIIPTLNAYCRKGPSTLYNLVTVLQQGIAYSVNGRDGQDTWWQIQGPDKLVCWVGDANVDKQGPVEQATLIAGLVLPGIPSNFVSSYACDATLKTLGVSLNWGVTLNATGYSIYRNGVFLATIDSTQTSYHDDAPVGVDLVYELEAVNDNGVAPRTSLSVPACK